jgi:hypothetical protein
MSISPDTALLSDYIDVGVFAAEVKRCERTVRRWMNQPDGLPYTKIGSRRLIRRESGKKWIAAQEHQPNQRKRSRRQSPVGAAA